MKKLLALILVGVMILVPACRVDDGGNGKEEKYADIKWTFEDGVLTISGKGKMPNYAGSYVNSEKSECAPWIEESNSIYEVIIKNGITSIGNDAFCGCESLMSIEIPESVTTIGGYAFYGCESLMSIKIPDSVTIIGDETFSFCKSLTSIEIPDSVTIIGERTFWSCDSLASIEIPASIITIGEGTFSCCDNLNSIHVDKNNEKYMDFDGVLYTKGMEKIVAYPARNGSSYSIPESVTSIGDYAFYSCGSLMSVEIPESVTSIGDSAFSYCHDLAIYGKAGSYAEEYAIKKDIPFSVIE